MLPCGRPLDCPLTPIPQQPRLSSSLVKVHQVNPSSRKVSLRLPRDLTALIEQDGGDDNQARQAVYPPRPA